MRYIISIVFALLISCFVKADNGHRLWLRMEANESPKKIINDKKTNEKDYAGTLSIAINELATYIKGNVRIHVAVDASAPKKDGFSITRKGNDIHIESASQIGILYGAYHLLRLQELNKMPKNGVEIKEIPTSKLRLLNHWDNLNGTIERGYAGRSIFWSNDSDIIGKNKSLIIEYARANASIGINGTILNNVNANPKVLSSGYLNQVKRIADILRPYGLKVYLSVNFASPNALGDLTTADPFDKNVIKWWQNKAKEIYSIIPDFGGFLVKANSEGEAGPQDFGRTHVDGANMIADALKPFGGIVMWRAFVYAANSADRACQAYNEFMPLDGQFRDNVILQIKNGPIDFQPREPIHPLFFSLKKTKFMPELQITQEYLGESIHSVFLSPMWHEITEKINVNIGIAGVSNIGNSSNWCGSDMAQANWYAFGRISWNNSISSEEIADEFVRQTFTKNSYAVNTIKTIMLQSHEACVNYMMPLGLHHIFAGGHHYGPGPWYYQKGCREDWLPRYYHKADSIGIGFDRTINGSKAVLQYPTELAKLYNNINTCPEKYLLWFHHVAWNQKLTNGETLWNCLCHKYDSGVKMAESFSQKWNSLKVYIDPDRFNSIKIKYERQAKDAWWWRDACLLYFQQFSKLQFPDDCPPCRHDLNTLMKFNLGIDNYTAAPIERLP